MRPNFSLDMCFSIIFFLDEYISYLSNKKPTEYIVATGYRFGPPEAINRPQADQ